MHLLEQVCTYDRFVLIIAALLGLQFTSGVSNSAKIKVVGLFDTSSTHLTSTFQDAVTVINDQNSEVQIIPVKVIANFSESVLKRSKRLCKIFETGVVAVISAPGSFSHEYAHSICDTLDIPFIGIRRTEVTYKDAVAINTYPYEMALSKPYTDIIRFWGWSSFTILYEHPDGLLKFRDMLNYVSFRFTITSRQLIGSDYRSVLRELRNSGENRIILDCATSSLARILRHAQQLKLLTRDYQYLLTTLDIHTINLSSFVYDHAKITSFQLIDFAANNNLRWIHNTATILPNLSTEQALLYDTVALISKTFDGEDISEIRPFRADCEKGESWVQGSEVLNALFHTEFDGLTGVIKSDAYGRRSEFILDIVQVTETGQATIGQWTTNDTIQIGPKLKPGGDVLKSKNLRAIIVLEQPYVMLKPDHDIRIGNDKYEGYAVDLMNIIMQRLELNYTLEDKGKLGHGVYDNTTNSWTGLIGELVNRRADVVVGGITINHERENVVDFTKPFMHLGISILYKKPEKKPPDLFSFLHPFGADVWLYMTISFLVVSGTIFLLGRFTPYEWYNPHPCDESSNVVENQFTIGNSLWFTVGSLMQQGSDIAPRAMSTRTVAGSWWFFTLIMIASYTANLAAFLAVERTDQPIRSADDLAQQTVIRYGCYKGGATYNFFKESKHPVYQKMWQFMRSDPTNFHTSSQDGIQAVKNGKYAFFMETPSLEYTVNQNCDMTQIDSPYRDLISKEILRLQENSELEVLKDKWWKGKSQVICADAGASDSGASELGMANVGGVFVVLLGGIGTALICAAMEFLWQVGKDSKSSGTPFGKQFVRAFIFALLLRPPKDDEAKKR
ncbi:glutamate receptor ionotropic, kainate 3-like isoform X2 [Paramacrobiotus metropolitanus]|uniref:glutamate receptor ionotropic, kainate 3-like isoform X2 n=1 Tax=Paramacrobiotus metropolitanus TaxID=2943436 RepID=UPI0024464F37|nr:glutamate receptor ionotropic, kainate 3-like isoform X2 [Paramacrobiotus metropolitanus]